MGYSAGRPDRVQETLLGDSEQRASGSGRGLICYLPTRPFRAGNGLCCCPRRTLFPHPAHWLDSLDPTTTPDMTA